MDFATSVSLSCPLRPDEFELTVFGPGIGECLLIHAGNNDWCVIDSCRYPGSSSPVAIEYLEGMGIEPGNAVKRILATHWHDDHIRGLGDIVRRCSSARFAMSAALEHSQFAQLVFEIEEQNKSVAGSSSSTEFADILEQMISRRCQPPAGVSDGFLLFQGGFWNSVSVTALSPSASTVQHSHTKIAKLF